MHLTVIHPFGDYKRGDKISDPNLISELLEGKEGKPHDNVRHVVRTAGSTEIVAPTEEPVT
jgi:hypothetical protein